VVAASPQQTARDHGVVIGGGIDIHVIVLHVAPEIRFTRWARTTSTSRLLNSSKNQAEFLVGFTF